jgi:hypothetical protein
VADVITTLLNLELLGLIQKSGPSDSDYFYVLTQKGLEKAGHILASLPMEDFVLISLLLSVVTLD